MNQYITILVDFFSNLDLQTIELFIKNLNIDEFKILYSLILPQVSDQQRRIQLKTLFAELNQPIIENSTPTNSSLEELYKKLGIHILSSLHQDEMTQRLIALCELDELYLLRRFTPAANSELALRKKTSDPLIWMKAFRKQKAEEKNLELTSNLWKQILKKIQLSKQKLSDSQPKPISDRPKLNPSILQQIQLFFTKLWSEISNFFTKIEHFMFGAPIKEKKIPYNLEINDAERTTLEEMRQRNANFVAQMTGLSQIGENNERNKTIKEAAIQARFGMVLSSQMVAGTQTKKHKDLFTVLDSLIQYNDSDATLNNLKTTILSITEEPQTNFFKSEHAFSTGGSPHLVTAFESNTIKKLATHPECFQDLGIEISAEEQASIVKYHDNLNQSKDLNHMLRDIHISWGGYVNIKGQSGQYQKDGDRFEKKQADFENQLLLASKGLLEACDQLKNNETLYIETGLEEHAMQLCIKREKDGFKISTYDPSGSLENTTLNKGGIDGISGKSSKLSQFFHRIGGLIKLAFLGKDGLRKNSLSFSVPYEQLISPQGLNYLKQLIRSNSIAGWAETRIALGTKHTTIEERSQMNLFKKLMALDVQSNVYSNYVKLFCSLATPESEPKFEELLQRPQNTSNCFAKKAQSCELYELGKPLYKKVRLAILLEQKKGLLDDICGNDEDSFVDMEYVEFLKTIEPQYLSPRELHDVSLRLCEVSTPPTAAYYKNFFNTLLVTKSKLLSTTGSDAQLAIQRIDAKLSTHAKAYYLYLKNAGRFNEIENLFSPLLWKEDATYNWDSGSCPMKTSKEGLIDPTALERLSEFSSAMTWKASIQLINHQIKKLSVNQRYINNEERLSSSLLGFNFNDISLNDLENANIVSFSTGISRKEEFKVEINFGSERKEIDVDAFFDLVVKNTEALTLPKVMGLLDFLRNANPDFEKQYQHQVYPIQRKAIVDKLEQLITQSTNNLALTLSDFNAQEKQIAAMINQSIHSIAQLNEQLSKEQAQIGVNRKSLSINIWDSRLELLKSEQSELKRLHTSIQIKIQNLQTSFLVQGSSEYKITKAKEILDQLRNHSSKFVTINEANTAYSHASEQLQSMQKHLEQITQRFNTNDIEEEANDRLKQLNQYKEQILIQHLATHPEYRILEELSLGKMGTDKDRNRQLYHQTPEERTEFFKQGKNSYLNNSVYHEIKSLSQQFKEKIIHSALNELLAKTTCVKPNSLENLISDNEYYSNLEDQVYELNQLPLSLEIKHQWVNGLVSIWLKHQNIDQLHFLQTQTKDQSLSAINKSFHQFLAQKTNIQYVTLKELGYPIDLNANDIAKFDWKPISESEITAFRAHQQAMSSKITQTLKASIKPQNKLTIANPKPLKLTSNDLIALPQLQAKPSFEPPKFIFFTQDGTEQLTKSSLKFLREHPKPQLKDNSQQECEIYFTKVEHYLHVLIAQPKLENKERLITEFCHNIASQLSKLPHSPHHSLVETLSMSLLAPYKDQEGSLHQAFLVLENAERVQLLTHLLQLNLSQLNGTSVHPKLFSTLKHWERLIIPKNENLSQKIALLRSDSSANQDFALFTEVDIALHASPISLEAVHEGQRGLQFALTNYGKETKDEFSLRQLADRLGMRNGDILLARQFINYYSNHKFLMSNEALNSTQGRELFDRAFQDAFFHASPKDKLHLINFLKQLNFNDKIQPCTLKTPHKLFIDELLVKNSLQNKQLKDLPSAESAEFFINSLTHFKTKDGTERLLGFAKTCNLLALKIQHAQSKNPINSQELVTLCSKFICSNLAYQLILDQASEEICAQLRKNFEYHREMSLLQTQINTLQDTLVEFATSLEQPNKAEQFSKIFKGFINDKKFAGPKFQLTGIACPIADLPGFISLGSNKSLDVIHGNIYQGINKLGMMPANIKSHIALKELGIDHLPFKPHEKGYVYVEEDNAIKVSVTAQKNDQLIIQRELTTLDNCSKLLQYIPTDQMDSLPIALKRRIKAEHYFFDNTGTIHAFNAQFKPLLSLSNSNGIWTGQLLDHRNSIIPISFGIDRTPRLQKLTDIIPSEEMLLINEETVYVPAISQYISINQNKKNYLLSRNLKDDSTKKVLTISPRGNGFTEKELTQAELKQLNQLNKQSNKLHEEFNSIATKDIHSKQRKTIIKHKIKLITSQINQLTQPEFFLFVGHNSQSIAMEEKQVQLRHQMNTAYQEIEVGVPTNNLSANYEQTKQNYLDNKLLLNKTYSNIDCLRTYTKNNDRLIAKNLFSIFHIGNLPNKTSIFLQLLSTLILVTPLTSCELLELQHLQKSFSSESATLMQRQSLLMLIGLELQHLLLEREFCVTGQLKLWNRERFIRLIQEFEQLAKQLQPQSEKNQFAMQGSKLWSVIGSEFNDEDLHQLFAEAVISPIATVPKPININKNLDELPITAINGAHLIEYHIHDNVLALMDTTQIQLEQKLRNLEPYQEAIQLQEDGYYYENYGLFNINTLAQIFNINELQVGIGGLSKECSEKLFHLMHKENWIRPVTGKLAFQLSAHPKEFYSPAKITALLVELGYAPNDIQTVCKKLEEFLYQTMLNAGSFSISENNKSQLELLLKEEGKRCNTEYLMAVDQIDLLRTASVDPIVQADLNAAYLLNDYSKLLAYFPEEKRNSVNKALNNAMTRLLIAKTELDHYQDIQKTFDLGQPAKALTLLHIKRNYELDTLLESTSFTSKKPPTPKMLEQDRKMHRAFLLFESEFGHRCNAKQVAIFRSLLLDDDTNPNKIDSAQARMGFGKTSLLPLVALYKTGEHLVRFIVPKSALETNTADISSTLKNILGSRAVKDNFMRYKIETDLESDMGDLSPRLLSLQDAKADLKKRLHWYKKIRDHREILVQAPNVRNSLECQSKIFLALLLQINPKETKQIQELMSCISLLNEIRSLTTFSVFDELDATQDRLSTDVNYTSGEKISFNITEIQPLEIITQTILKAPNKSPAYLAKKLLKQFNIKDTDHRIFDYLLSLKVKQPENLDLSHCTAIYLMRAILSDPSMLSLFTEKQAGTDYGVWFKNGVGGTKLYDYDSLKTDGQSSSNLPLLITVPYSAANTPKPQGSRFDNPEVTAITTYLYYLDIRTELSEAHLEFLIEFFKKGIGETLYLDSKSQSIDLEFKIIFDEIKKLAEIEDSFYRNSKAQNYFSSLNTKPLEQKISFRKMLVRAIIQDQIQFDAGKSNSNRYEQGTLNDVVIGFSGTASDTSTHFNTNKLDPAADGNMTLGIMGRANCQSTLTLNTDKLTELDGEYTSALLMQLSASYSKNTRALIDVGGLCKITNWAVALEIAKALKNNVRLKSLKGVIFYDDVTNLKNVLMLTADNKVIVSPLTNEMANLSESNDHYFTYYDQSHSRGADINQKDGAHALITLSANVTNNDFKQGIMRMRKIADKNLDVSFTTALPQTLRIQILDDLNQDQNSVLQGNDIAYWLRKKELQQDVKAPSILIMELDALIKNTILQQQAELTNALSKFELNEEPIKQFRECIRALNAISPFISGSLMDLKDRYGGIYGEIHKNDFLIELRTSFDNKIRAIYTIVNQTRQELHIPPIKEALKNQHAAVKERIISKRMSQLAECFIMPSAQNALSESYSETESQVQNQSASQNQTQTQTHSFSEVNNENAYGNATLKKENLNLEPLSLDYLNHEDHLQQLALVSDIQHLQHLFSPLDPIRCSKTYLIETKQNPLQPPIHYFLAREQGDPKIILINQDEANLYLKSPLKTWSLYNIRYKTGEFLSPLSGPMVAATSQHPMMKKLKFAAFRHQVTGNDLPSLGHSLEGICPTEHLQPALNISFETTKSLDSQEPIFHLSRWGFSGIKHQEIPLHIHQTQELFKENAFEKKGITLHIGEGDRMAEIFISSKLNQRILSRTPPHSPKLQVVIAEIKQEYQQAMDERLNLREGKAKGTSESLKDNLVSIKAAKKKITEEYGQIIARLEAQKQQLISEGKEKIIGRFPDAMQTFLDKRKITEYGLEQSISYLLAARCQGISQFGFPVSGSIKENLTIAVISCYRDIYKLPALSQKELSKKLNSSIQTVFEAVKSAVAVYIPNYATRNITLLEAMWEVTKAPNDLNTPITLWREPFKITLRHHLYDYLCHWKALNLQETHRELPIWENFNTILEKVINNAKGKELTLEEFQTELMLKVKEFTITHNLDTEDILADLKNRLCYSLNTSNSEQTNAKAIHEDLFNIVIKRFISVAQNPNEELTELYTQIHDLVKNKAQSITFNIPEFLLDCNQFHYADKDIQKAIEIILKEQHIKVVPSELAAISKKTKAFLGGQKELIKILAHYKPVERRSSHLEPVDGQERKWFTKSYELLVDMDTKVLAIQKEIDDAKAQRKDELGKLEVKHAALRVQLAVNNTKLKKLKAEISATNKLQRGVQNLLGIFSEQQVVLNKTDPIDFLDTHFELHTIIKEEIQAKAQLKFTPPEFYKLEEDMEVQRERLHGLAPFLETSAKNSLDKAVELVKREATEVQTRTCTLQGLKLKATKASHLARYKEQVAKMDIKEEDKEPTSRLQM